MLFSVQMLFPVMNNTFADGDASQWSGFSGAVEEDYGDGYADGDDEGADVFGGDAAGAMSADESAGDRGYQHCEGLGPPDFAGHDEEDWRATAFMAAASKVLLAFIS